ncbi:unnamed protein product [Plutella xylostella]|uniref:(diamondback moth) hypothetical protein n=1 Tax=Plutella xylostella TaxID=51655 RepID=A0A8S4GAU1_PLUXY|nr:unnamed protein product [Plutella xylostella]
MAHYYLLILLAFSSTSNARKHGVDNTAPLLRTFYSTNDGVVPPPMTRTTPNILQRFITVFDKTGERIHNYIKNLFRGNRETPVARSVVPSSTNPRRTIIISPLIYRAMRLILHEWA